MKKNLPAHVEVTESFETKKIVNTLSGLMEKVTEKECSPRTVEAACKCANSITDILRTHIEAEKLNFVRKNLKE